MRALVLPGHPGAGPQVAAEALAKWQVLALRLGVGSKP